MPDYPDLTLAREDMKRQSDLYRPSAFWDAASERIVGELVARGVDNFRTLPTISNGSAAAARLPSCDA